ncbi:hypothetical protein [Cupriavidus sp. TA19]|nr:hypothetical protein [Cupriavidus sp. TA19]
MPLQQPGANSRDPARKPARKPAHLGLASEDVHWVAGPALC